MPSSLISETVTEGIRVKAIASYQHEQSSPGDDKFIFTYKISITNEGVQRARLLSRHWVIINGNGDREDVEGPGVVGKTPNIAPGEMFQYTSFCPLNTEWGTMEGTFHMQREDGAKFDIAIGRFYLAMSAPQMADAV